MKTYFIKTKLFIVLFFIFSYTAFSQHAMTSGILLSENPENKDFVEFTAKKYDNTVYLKWVVTSDENDYTFLIQRSFDGVNYETLAIKSAFGAKVELDILYCYKDETGLMSTENMLYRICKIENIGNEITYSKATMPESIKRNEINKDRTVAKR